MSPSPTVRRRMMPWVLGGLALVLVVGVVGVSLALAPRQPPPAVTAAAPTATPTPTPTPTAARVRPVAGSDAEIVGWTVAGSTELAAVRAQVGAAAEGEMAVMIDAPSVAEPTRALGLAVPVEPLTEYTVTVAVRSSMPALDDAPAQVRLGSASRDLPELNADWQDVELDYRTAADETSAEIGIWLMSAMRGLVVDDVRLSAHGSAVQLPNGSFEDVASSWGIRNPSLILQRDSAGLAVSMAPGNATWVAADGAGVEVARGQAVLREGISLVPLARLAQGYYDVALTDATGASVRTPVVVVDMPGPFVPIETRIGTHVHAQKDFAADATPTAAAVGIGTVRVVDSWRETEKETGVYTFSEVFTRAFAEADALTMDTVMIVSRANRLYDASRTPSTPEGFAAWERYAAALAGHFDADAYEIYNEFNIEAVNTSRCGLTPECYLPLLAAGSAGVRSVDPDAVVIGGVTGNAVPEWFERLWQAGGLEHVDAISFHPYEVYGDPTALEGILDTSRDVASRYGSAPPIWITELGWTSKTGDVTLQQQGERLVQSQAAGLAAGAERMFWYNLVNDTTDRADHEGNFGLFEQRREGVAGFPPKPAALSQALFALAIHGKQYEGHSDEGGVWSATFADDAGVMRVAWTRGEDAQLEFAGDEPVRVTRTDGFVTEVVPVDGTVTVPVTSVPVVIE